VFAPEAVVRAADSHNWIDDPFSKGVWLSWRPGWVELEEEFAEPQGRVAFAGSDIAADGAGYMEGAIVSGHAAAETTTRLLTLAGTE
jgi:monoamine oxidase